MPQAAQIPAGFKDSYFGTDPGFEDPEHNNYRLTPESPVFDIAAEPIEYIDGDGESHTLVIIPT